MVWVDAHDAASSYVLVLGTYVSILPHLPLFQSRQIYLSWVFIIAVEC